MKTWKSTEHKIFEDGGGNQHLRCRRARFFGATFARLDGRWCGTSFFHRNQPGMGCKRSTDSARVAHLRANVAARPRMQATVHDARTAGLLTADILSDRLLLLTATASTTSTETSDDSEQAAATRYLQKKALIADQAWQQTVRGRRGPSLVQCSLMSGLQAPSQQTARRARMSAPQLQQQHSRLRDMTKLWRLKMTSRSKGYGLNTCAARMS